MPMAVWLSDNALASINVQSNLVSSPPLVHHQIVATGELTGKQQAAKHPTDKSCYCSDNISINILKLHCHNE